MVCVSASDEKLKPLVVVRGARPRCFRGFANVGVDYFNDEAWVNTSIFTEWVKTLKKQDDHFETKDSAVCGQF